MMKIKRKLISGGILSICSVFTVMAGAHISQKASDNAIPVSVGQFEETPVIILDAGHGGFDGGCTSAEGIPEKGINLNIMLKLRDMLEMNGYEVIVTRNEDRSIHDDGIEGLSAQKSSDMDNRLDIFNSRDNAVCVSIHQNQFNESRYSGAQMFYSSTNKKSEPLAKAIQKRFVEFLQPDNSREIKQCGKELFLCYYSKNPTVMVECGFLSNPEEAALLADEDYQSKVAFTIFSGINDFANLK